MDAWPRLLRAYLPGDALACNALADALACNASSLCSSKFEQLVKPLLDRTVQVGGSHAVLSYHCAFAVAGETVWPLACYCGDRTTMHTLWARRPCCSQATPSPLHLAACGSPRRPLVLPPLSVAQPCHNCMKDAGVQPADIQEVLMVGGMSRMPKVRGCAPRLGNWSRLLPGLSTRALVAKWSDCGLVQRCYLPLSSSALLSFPALPPAANQCVSFLPHSATPGERDGARDFQEGAQPVDEPR